MEVALRAATTGLSETETMVTMEMAVAGSTAGAAVAAVEEEVISCAPEQAQDPFLPHGPLRRSRITMTKVRLKQEP